MRDLMQHIRNCNVLFQDSFKHLSIYIYDFSVTENTPNKQYCAAKRLVLVIKT